MSAIERAFEIARLTRQPETMKDRQDTVTDAEALLTALRRRMKQADKLAGAAGEVVATVNYTGRARVREVRKLAAALAAYRETEQS